MIEVSPSEWGARINYDTKVWRPWQPDKYVIHWGGSPGGTYGDAVKGNVADEMEQLRRWEAFHIDVRGWLGIAYNRAIGNSGTLYRLRGDNRSGATSGDYESDGIPENHEGDAYLFILGEGNEPSDKALTTFTAVYAANPRPVIGHRDVFLNSGTGTNTVCPGMTLWNWVQNEGYKGGSSMAFLPITPNSPAAIIAWLQRRLNVAGNANLLPDGVWGPLTEQAVATIIPDSTPSSVGGNDWANLDLLYTQAAAASNHNHDSVYAKKGHGHTTFSKLGHKHTISGSTDPDNG